VSAVAPIEIDFLTDGGQPAERTATKLLDFFAGARATLDLAIYDAHFDDGIGTRIVAALDAAEARGVRVRAVYNDVHHKQTVPPPPEGPSLLRQLAAAVPSEAIPGVPDLMHDKYVVRDGETVWTGSTNWTSDAWTRMENLIVTVESSDLAAAYTRDFEQLWAKRHVDHTGTFDDDPATLPGGTSVRALFSPGRGRKMSQLVATHLGQARRRIRICSPVITSSPILATLAELVDDAGCDALITVDGPQMRQVLQQWRADGRAAWKGPLYERVVASGKVAAKPSTPYAPNATHDYMHAKLVVCDDWVLTGSYNCSHSGEMNAENLLEIHDAALADRCATFCEQVHARYAPVTAH
jgi:phosphatidylserine/phosphatidylglycerophosphate/cardiolipin synthase-like enzyme